MKIWLLNEDNTLKFEYDVPKGAAGEDLLPSVPFAETSPPAVSDNQIAVYESGEWSIKDDFREVRYWIGNESFVIDEIGEALPEGATLEYIPSINEKFEQVRQALQFAIDSKAKELGFSGGNALILYAGFTNAFQSLAQQFASWEVSVWVQAEAYKQGVIAGDNPMVSTQQAVEMMPPYN